jgi:hypothetical protein
MKMKLKQQIKYWFLNLIEPIYLRLVKEFAELKRREDLKIAKALAEEMYQRRHAKLKAQHERLAQTEFICEKPSKPHQELLEEKQKNCRHSKGGYVRGPIVDYNISHHIFIDGSERIKCLTCSKTWVPSDPDWKDVVKMMYYSTNRTTTSERLLKGENR